MTEAPSSNQAITYPNAPNKSMKSYQQVQMQAGGNQFEYVKDPIAELGNCESILIKQQPDILEVATNFQTENKYLVFGQSTKGLKFLFKCMEKSGSCMRFCCPADQREFNMDLMHISSAEDFNTNNPKIFGNIYKPFKCTMCCCSRPEITIKLSDGDKKVGAIKNIFTCCNPEFEVYDENEKVKFLLTADCCQCGLMCKGLCGKLSEVVFNILNPDNKEIIGNITKKVANSSEVFSNADSYQVIFPQNTTPNDKFLLTGLGLMIDYQFFESGSSTRSTGGFGVRY